MTYQNLTPYRKKLRKQMTPAEIRLWFYLKNKQIEGRRFRRQHQLFHFIVDFYCPEEKIVIELDGEGHNHIETAENDIARDCFLKENGFKIIRIENKHIFENPDGVIEYIKSFFK